MDCHSFLTLYKLMHSAIWYYTMNLKWFIVNIKGSQDIISKLQSRGIVFILANSADLAEMPVLLVFQIDVHCLPRYTVNNKCNFATK